METAASDREGVNKDGGRRAGQAVRVDKGWAWVVMIAFLVNCFLRIGYFKSFGIIFLEYLRTLQQSVAATSVVVGFIAVGFSIGGFLTLTVFMPRLSVRKCVIMGGLVTFAGVILSSFSSSLAVIVLTQGFLVGFGHVVLYLPGQTLMALYFRKWRSLAIHVVNVGAGFGAVAFPPILHFLIAEYGLNGCLLIVSAILLNAVVCGALMRPLGLKGGVRLEEALLEEQMREEDVLGCEVPIGEAPEDVDQDGPRPPNGYLGKRRESQTAMVLQEIEKDVENLEPLLEKVSEAEPVLPAEDHYATVPSSPFGGVTMVNTTPICCTGEVKRNDSAPIICNSTDLPVDSSQSFNLSEVEDSKAVVNISRLKFQVGGDEDDGGCGAGGTAAPAAEPPRPGKPEQEAPSVVVEDADARPKPSEVTPLLRPPPLDTSAIKVLDSAGAADTGPLTPKSIKAEPEGPQIAALCILADPSLPVTSLASNPGHGMKFHGSAPALGMAAFEVVEVVDATALQAAGSGAGREEGDEAGCWDALVAARRSLDSALFREPLFYVLLTQALLSLLPTNLMLTFLPAFVWERGLTDLQTVVLLVLVAVCSIVSKVVTGLLLEYKKVLPSSVLAASSLVMGVAGVLVPLCSQFWMFFLFAAAFGLVADVYYGLIALLAEEFLGQERLDQVVLLTILFEGVFLAVAVPLCGLIRDCTGSFDHVYQCLGACALLAALVILVERCAPCKSATRQTVKSEVNGKTANSSGHV